MNDINLVDLTSLPFNNKELWINLRNLFKDLFTTKLLKHSTNKNIFNYVVYLLQINCLTMLIALKLFADETIRS